MDTEQLTTSMPIFYQKRRWWLGLFLCLLITSLSLWLLFNPAWVQQFGNWGYLGTAIISLISSATVFLPAPGIALIIAAGQALNPLYLSMAAGAGSAVGELTGYVAGATGRALIPEEQQARFDRLQQLIDKYNNALVLGFLAAIPFPLFDLAGIIAGIIKMRVASFLIAVAVGKCIRYLLLIWLSNLSVQWLWG